MSIPPPILSQPTRANRNDARRTVWTEFAEANRSICNGFFQPRLYMISHMSALDWWFQRRIASLPVRDRLLEFGSGRHFPLSRLLKDAFKVCEATDVEDVQRSSWPDGVTFRRCEASTLPFEDSQFDAVVIRSVVEHLAEPARVFRELSRVMKPGARAFMNLPNKWDYVSVLSRSAGPLKSAVLQKVVPNAWEDFPVHYRCNTRRTLTRALRGSDLAIEHFRPFPSEPGCLKFFFPLYLAGAIYQFVISILALDFLQPAFLVVLRKGDALK